MTKQIQTIILLVLASCCLPLSLFAESDDSMSIADIEVQQGASVALPVSMNNAETIDGFQFSLSLPEGVTLAAVEKTARTEGRIDVYQNLADGVYKFSALSMSGKNIEGNEGEILSLTLAVAESVALGEKEIKLTDILLFAENGEEIHVADCAATLTVLPKVIASESIALNKTALSLLIGEQEKLVATITPENTTDKTVVWSTSDASIATVEADGTVKAIAVGTATITAKNGNNSATCSVTVNPIVSTGVTLNKTTLSLLIGEQEQLVATVTPENTTDKTVVWSTSDASIATVDADGTVKAIAVGTATITATNGNNSATCSVTVSAIASTGITLNKSTLSLLIGEQEQLVATVTPENTTDKTVVWSTSDASIATVDADGTVKAIAVGTATITAKNGNNSATCSVTVSAIASTGVTLNKATLSLLIGEQEQLVATVTPENTTDKTVVWSTSDASIATVDADGTVKAIAVGTATITATNGNNSATCSVTVCPIASTGVTLNKATLSLLIGEQEQLVATVSPENATDKTVVWSISNASIATVDADGTVKAIAVGTATITATNGNNSASCSVTVSAIASTGVTLNKTTLSLLIGEQEQLVATVSPENTTDKTVVWSTSDASIATVDAEGTVKAIAVGTATITATNGNNSATCSVTVSAIASTGVTLNKTALSLLIGEQEQLVATITPENATDKTVVWSTSDASIATVDADGTVKAIAVGTATITATNGNNSATCSVTVSAIASTGVTLNKTTLSLLIGEQEQLVATVTPENATDQTVTWTSSNPSVAKVSSDGTVTAVAAGTSYIKAKNGSLSARCKVTVSKHSQEIIWEQEFDAIEVGESIELTAEATSGLEISYKVTKGEAQLSGNLLTLTAEGEVEVCASQNGDETYSAAEPVYKTINVIDGIRDISLDADAELRVTTLSGLLLFSGRAAELPKLPRGIYLVQQGSRSCKFIVKP